MNPIYFLLIIPLIAPLLVLYFGKRFNRESLFPTSLLIGGSTAILAIIIALFVNYTTRDREVLNGFVTGKEINRFTCPVNTMNPCENGYSCNCHQVAYSCMSSDGKTATTCYRTECDTCYVYPWEQNFFVSSSLQGDRAYKIHRVDEQGAIEPPRWQKVKRGDPVSITHSYTNYILGALDSIFAEDGVAEEKYKDIIPTYPLEIYDYYNIDRLVTVGKVNVDRKSWNKNISRILVRLGPEKQANAIVVIAEGVEMDFANAVRRAWRGFKKNDIVVFTGVDAKGNLQWVRAMSWSKQSMVNIKIESEILRLFKGKPLEPVMFTDTVSNVGLKHFERRSMEEFKYLKDEAAMSTTQVVWIWIISFIIVIGTLALQLHLLDMVPMFLTGRPAHGNVYSARYFQALSRSRRIR